MVRRSTSKAKAIEQAFPIRVRVRWSDKALPGLLHAVEVWAVEALGRNRLACGSASMVHQNEGAIYLRSVEELERCLRAFPELELRDLARLDDGKVYTDQRSAAHSVGQARLPD